MTGTFELHSSFLKVCAEQPNMIQEISNKDQEELKDKQFENLKNKINKLIKKKIKSYI